MWTRARTLLTDPRMITIWVFSAFLIIIFSVVSARPWNATAVEETTKNLQECEYFQADGREIFNYNIEDIQIQKCVDRIWEKLQKQERKNKKRERRRRRKGRKSGRKGRKGRGKKNKRNRKSNKNRRPQTKSGDTRPRFEARRQRMKRQRKMFLEQEEFRKWKRKVSVANLLSEPVAQEAIGDLWADLIDRGPEWEEIYRDMHSNLDPLHIQHKHKPEKDSLNSSTPSVDEPDSDTSTSTLPPISSSSTSTEHLSI